MHPPMAGLTLHIEFLLQRKECVILPNLGAFIATRMPAAFDMERGLLLPPRREISFNPEVRADDGLLAHSVARRLGISFQEARLEVEREVGEFRSLLAAGRELELANIGTLVPESGGAVSFRPYLEEARRQSLEGCSSLRLPQERAKEEETLSSASDSKEQGDLAERTAAASSWKQRPDKYYYIAIPKWPARIAASLVVVAVACVVLLAPRSSNSGQETTRMASVVPVETIVGMASDQYRSLKGEIDSSSPAEGSVKGTEDSASDGEQSSRATEESSSSSSDSAKGNYHLIIGTFNTEAGARQFMQSELAAGRNASLCPGRNGIWRVEAASSQDREELLREMRTPAMRQNHPQSWIWESAR